MRALLIAVLLGLSAPAFADENCVYRSATGSTATVPDDLSPITIDWAGGQHEVCPRDLKNYEVDCPTTGNMGMFFIDSAPTPKSKPLLVLNRKSWFQVSCGSPA